MISTVPSGWRSTAALVICGLSGCGGADIQSAAESAALTLQAVHASDARQALAACDALNDGQASASCRVDVVRRHGLLDEALCGELSPGAWRDECFFVMAETTVMGGNPDGARVLCASAGRQRGACQGHVLLATYRRILAQCAHPVDCLESARPLVTRAVGEPPDTLERAWSDFYFQGLGSVEPLSLEPCQRAPSAADAAICQRQIHLYVQRRILAWLTGPQNSLADVEAFCAGSGALPVASGILGVHDRASFQSDLERAFWLGCDPRGRQEPWPWAASGATTERRLKRKGT